jgi:hypothetical protein
VIISEGASQCFSGIPEENLSEILFKDLRAFRHGIHSGSAPTVVLENG